MRLLFLNQYFPPDSAPTGALLKELAEHCALGGHEVQCIDAAQIYRAEQPPKMSRMRRELLALRTLWRRGRDGPRADVVISGTSPPCLGYIAHRIARRHRARHLHWAMDLYPELAVALGEIKDGSLVHRITRWMMGSAYRQAAKIVALDEDMREHLRRGHGVEAETIRPWLTKPILEQLTSARSEGPQKSWIYSGNLGRAHEYATLIEAQQILEQRCGEVRLIFQGAGPGREGARAMASRAGLQRCEWRDFAPEDHLVRSLLKHQVLVVSQRPEVRGLLWPSKLGLTMALERPLLFVGPSEGAIADEIRKRLHTGIFAPGDAMGVANWLETQFNQTAPMTRSQLAAAERTDALNRWLKLIENTPPR